MNPTGNKSSSSEDFYVSEKAKQKIKHEKITKQKQNEAFEDWTENEDLYSQLDSKTIARLKKIK